MDGREDGRRCRILLTIKITMSKRTIKTIVFVLS